MLVHGHRIGMNLVIKVADFGLAEMLGNKEYFRQDKTVIVKLPLRWLAPESLEDHIFSEKSDVVSLNVAPIPYSSSSSLTIIIVGLWSDLLGDFQWREGPLSWC